MLLLASCSIRSHEAHRKVVSGLLLLLGYSYIEPADLVQVHLGGCLSNRKALARPLRPPSPGSREGLDLYFQALALRALYKVSICFLSLVVYEFLKALYKVSFGSYHW